MGTLPSRRAIVDSSFAIALILSLRDAAAKANYVAHPTHGKTCRRNPEATGENDSCLRFHPDSRLT
jgi:hypothetical protein